MFIDRSWGTNGIILPELKILFRDIEVIRLPGVINAWRWPVFRKAVDDTGRKKIIIAGISDATCLQFPSLDAILEGFDVHAVIDASDAEIQADWLIDEARQQHRTDGSTREKAQSMITRNLTL